MPTYGYDCARCGAFDLVRPMAQVDAPASCPVCGEPGRRRWGAPALRSLNPALTRALDASARTAEAPGVVDRVPLRRPRYMSDPRHLRLPRPWIQLPAQNSICGWRYRAPAAKASGRCALSCSGSSGSGRDVAQLGSALDWGSRGRRFKSCRPDAGQKGCRHDRHPFFMSRTAAKYSYAVSRMSPSSDAIGPI